MIVLYSPHDHSRLLGIAETLKKVGSSVTAAYGKDIKLEMDADLPAGHRVVLDDERRFIRLVVDPVVETTT